MPTLLIDVGVIAALLLLNGVLAMAEIAVVTARPARLQARAAKGSRGAAAALALRSDQTRFLSTVQVGITLVGILAGAFGGATLAEPLGEQLDRAAVIEPYGKAAAVAVVVGAITYFSLVIGELVPKRIGLQHPEAVAVLVARPMRVLSAAMSPLVAVLAFSTDSLLRAGGIPAASEQAVTEDEIRILVEQGSLAGVVEAGERDVIQRALRLADRSAGELATPRTQVEWLDLEDSPQELWSRIVGSQHAYLPAGRGSLDELVGVASVRELLLLAPGEGLAADVERVVQTADFVPEGASGVMLLELFRRTGRSVAIVVDEYGGIHGIVTLTDVLEALVGDIGPVQSSEPGIAVRSDGSLLVDGLFGIDDFKDQLALEELPGEAQFQTVGGFVVFQLGHIPAAGELFTYAGRTFEVVDMDGARVDKVLVTRPEDSEKAQGGSGA
jgi:putative hemolysin